MKPKGLPTVLLTSSFLTPRFQRSSQSHTINDALTVYVDDDVENNENSRFSLFFGSLFMKTHMDKVWKGIKQGGLRGLRQHPAEVSVPHATSQRAIKQLEEPKRLFSFLKALHFIHQPKGKRSDYQ